MKIQNYYRSLPYFKLLINAPSQKRKSMLRSFPNHVLDDMRTIIMNAIMGNVRVNKKFEIFAKKHNRQLKSILNTPKRDRNPFILNQGGGFIGAILPLLAGIIGATL